MSHSPPDTIAAQADETSADKTNSNSKSAQPTHLRSCVLCRQRKVKCDRRQPCSNCIRAEATCVHPPGAGRAAKRPRQVVDTKVLHRLSQLETTIRRLQQQTKGREADSDSHVASEASASPQHALSTRSEAQDRRDLPANASLGSATIPEFGRLVVEESQSRYVSNIMWADLTESVEQLRGMFLNTNSKDEDSSWQDDSPPFYDEESPTVGTLGSNAAILGYRSLAHSLRDFHPSLELSMRLFQIFSDNVFPFVRIFHMPALTRLFWDAVVTPDSLDKETEALLFAIYYSAVISLDSAQCAEIIGAPRYATAERYRFAAEQALARANLLNTQSMLLLQAALLYLSVLRSDDGTRAVWSLIALASHVARSMGLHRDGTTFNLSPFETEMRRRIWHHVCLLDHRSTEYHGCEPTVADETAFDTRWPLNVNDSDLSPEMTELPPESDGATDMTVVHVRCHALRVNWEMKRNMRLLTGSRSLFQARVQFVDEHDRWIEKYIERCDPAQPLLHLSREISYMVAARMRLITYYSELMSRKQKGEASAPHTNDVNSSSDGPGHGGSEVEPDTKSLRDQLFATAIGMLKRSDDIMKDPSLSRWTWHSHTYIQWQVIALALSEICIRPPCPQCDEAWKYATAVYDKWLSVKFRDNTERGDNFVKPIGLLLAKARRVRDMQQAQTQTQMPRSDTGEWMMPGQRILYDTPGSRTSLSFGNMDTTSMDHGSHQVTRDCMTSTTTPSLDNSRNGPPVYGINNFDPFLEMLPDELQTDWFESIESMARENVSARRSSHEMTSATHFFSWP
ncbi:hypothetical protein HD806DRAFT_519308 [Xylariaceae sp. AK1471]|nr:hypothetical protein HD806DRAFT_519308 [Xylariaceae sp. AK1471]